jgi:RyR domain-containing protein
MGESGELPPEAAERVARAIHEGYRSDQIGRKPADDPALVVWEELPEHLRRSNRRQAAHIFEKLEAFGYTLHQVADGEVQVVSLPDDVLEEMAVMEHDRWEAERRAEGWRRGTERDVLRKVSPYVETSWDELPEDVREDDRKAVRRIPELLAAVGLEIRQPG